jgi:hypothetical protein
VQIVSTLSTNFRDTGRKAGGHTARLFGRLDRNGWKGETKEKRGEKRGEEGRRGTEKREKRGEEGQPE